MAKPYIMTAGRFATAAFQALVVFVMCAQANGQQPITPGSAERDRGIELYKQSDTKGAIKVLSAAVRRNKEDPETWYYLGLAQLYGNDPKNARKAFEAAIRLRPNFAPAHTALASLLLLTNRLQDAERETQQALSLGPQNAEARYLIGYIHLTKHSCTEAAENADAALKIAPDFALAYLLKAQSLLCSYADTSLRPYLFDGTVFRTGAVTTELSREEKLANARRAAEQFKEVAQNLERYLQLAPNAEDASMWRDQLEALRVHAEPIGNLGANRTVFNALEVTTKARVLAKPAPVYSQTAREAQIEGTVVLRVVLAADGTVNHILVLNSLPKGLTQQAIRAAQQIKFVPATIDGRAVSMFVQLEYNFNLY